jgi:hypothetical protein
LPVTLTLVKDRLALPVFVKVTASAGLVEFRTWLANVSDAGVTVAAGAAGAEALTPVPESATCCGLAAASSVNLIAPVSVPTVVGVNVTEMVQLAPAGRLDGQAVVSAKLPEAPMPLIDSEAAPEFVKVMV